LRLHYSQYELWDWRSDRCGDSIEALLRRSLSSARWLCFSCWPSWYPP